MTDAHTHEIVIRGRIGPRLLGPVRDDFTVIDADADRTRLAGTVRDSSHLQGVLAYLASINAELISIAPIPVDTGTTTTNTRSTR